MSEALILFTREHCELCETAASMAAAAGIAVEPVDIGTDVALLARYRDAIPVLRDPASGAELRWPFDPTALAEFGRRHRAPPAPEAAG